MPHCYWVNHRPDGEAPDEMNTELVGPLPYPPGGGADPRVLERIDPGALILEPISFDEWYQHQLDMEKED